MTEEHAIFGDRLHDLINVFFLEAEQVDILSQQLNVLVLQTVSRFVLALFFSAKHAALDVEAESDVLVINLLGVAHEDEVDGVLFTHCDLVHTIDTSKK